MAGSSNLSEKLRQLSLNLWWTWHPEIVAIFRDIDQDLWRDVNHNPVNFMQEIATDRLEERIRDREIADRIVEAVERLEVYRTTNRKWALRQASRLRVWPVAYFSAEFGIHESLPVYAGGLGLLAGDHLKSCSDMGIPVVGIGLLYYEGYFHQLLDEEGMQREEFWPYYVEKLPIEPVLSADGKSRLMVQVPLHGQQVDIQIWRAQVGRVDLYLLDSNVASNSQIDRSLTGRLYAGDAETRIQQEVILGVGGTRALAAVQRLPGAVHLNEGHCSFALLELIRLQMVWEGISFGEARDYVGRKSVFTTHTPVAAGHDVFSPELVEHHLRPLREGLGLSYDDFIGLGRISPGNPHEPFGMTPLALRICHRANGVSALHGYTSRKIWRPLWNMRPEQEIPIGHVTNGVHADSWLAPRMSELLDRYCGSQWREDMSEPSSWDGVANIPDHELWNTKRALKQTLIEFVRRRHARRMQRLGMEAEGEKQAAALLNPEALTIGFARRFAEYKRADLVFSEVDKLKRILGDPDRPVQIIFAGKAHPANHVGKECIKRIHEFSQEAGFAGRIALIEDYDISVGRHMVQGVDLWLNNPIRPLEASGTSGQKVVFNGGLNLSVLDGWWAEAFDGNNGFTIGYGGSHPNAAEQNRRDAEALYLALNKDVIPMFFDRNAEGIPVEWLGRVRWALQSLAWQFNAHRMVIDYFRECYLPAAGAGTCDFRRYRTTTTPG
jgi:starch phosphorylase